MIQVTYAGLNAEEENYSRIHRPNGSGDYLLLYFIMPMHVVLEREIIDAEEGDVLLYEPGIEQDYGSIREFRISYIHFQADKAEMDAFKFPKNIVFHPENPELVHEYMEQVCREYFTKNVHHEFQEDALLRNLFVILSRTFHSDEMNQKTNSLFFNKFLEARRVILANCEKEWASTNACEMVHLSRSQFYNYYEKFFGISPIADLNNERIQKAKYLLTNKEIHVTDVATMCGYKSIHHFSRTFKQHTGLSPIQYVKSIHRKPSDEMIDFTDFT